jgi:hypothetical protein
VAGMLKPRHPCRRVRLLLQHQRRQAEADRPPISLGCPRDSVATSGSFRPCRAQPSLVCATTTPDRSRRHRWRADRFRSARRSRSGCFSGQAAQIKPPIRMLTSPARTVQTRPEWRSTSASPPLTRPASTGAPRRRYRKATMRTQRRLRQQADVGAIQHTGSACASAAASRASASSGRLVDNSSGLNRRIRAVTGSAATRWT